MTANYIANICEIKLNSLNLDNPTDKQLYDYNRSTNVLSHYLEINFFNFIETELVYKWSKDICECRNKFFIWYNSVGWFFGDYYSAIKKYNGSLPSTLQYHLRKHYNLSRFN